MVRLKRFSCLAIDAGTVRAERGCVSQSPHQHSQEQFRKTPCRWSTTTTKDQPTPCNPPFHCHYSPSASFRVTWECQTIFCKPIRMGRMTALQARDIVSPFGLGARLHRVVDHVLQAGTDASPDRTILGIRFRFARSNGGKQCSFGPRGRTCGRRPWEVTHELLLPALFTLGHTQHRWLCRDISVYTNGCSRFWMLSSPDAVQLTGTRHRIHSPNRQHHHRPRQMNTQCDGATNVRCAMTEFVLF